MLEVVVVYISTFLLLYVTDLRHHSMTSIVLSDPQVRNDNVFYINTSSYYSYVIVIIIPLNCAIPGTLDLVTCLMGRSS